MPPSLSRPMASGLLTTSGATTQLILLVPSMPHSPSALGYEDINDHQRLRLDPLLAAALRENRPVRKGAPAAAASGYCLRTRSMQRSFGPPASQAWPRKP